MGCQTSTRNPQTTSVNQNVDKSKNSEKYLNPAAGANSSVYQDNRSMKSLKKSKQSQKNKSKLGSEVASRITGKSKMKNSKVIQTVGTPTCRYIFGSRTHEADLFQYPPEGYVSIAKVLGDATEAKDMKVNYTEEEKNVTKSNLVLPNHIMNYDLDEVGGIARTAVIPTFSYETKLQHDIFHRNRDSDDHVQMIASNKVIGSTIQYEPKNKQIKC